MRALVVVIALIAFGAVAFYAVQAYPPFIEADLKQRATKALTAANLPFAQVSVTGRVVTLSGEAPGPSAKEQAVKVAGDVWGVQSVTDELAVDTAALPATPQAAISPTSSTADQAPVEPAAPPATEQPPATALPTVESAVDPALAPPVAESEPSEPAPGSQETPASPAEQASAPAPSPSPQETQTAAAEPPVTSPAATAPVPAETPAPAPSVPPPAAPSVTSAPPSPAAPTVAAPITAATKTAITQGITTGLTTSVQTGAQIAAAAQPPTYRLEAHVEGKRVELQGTVSTPSAERALVAHVRRFIRRAEVVDTLKVAHTKPDKGWLGVARTGLSQLAHLDTGSLRLDGRKVSMSGRPKSENDRARVLAALKDLPSGYTSTVLLERMPEAAPKPAAAVVAAATPEPTPAPPPRKHTSRIQKRVVAAKYRTAWRPAPVSRWLSSDCRRRFDDVLPRVAVVFESGSARVRSNRIAGLDDLARVARICPAARIRLTGHSDTYEESAGETELSRERALAVREALEERGVSGASISVASRGDLRPVFSNATAEGRENNRRVEFAVW